MIKLCVDCIMRWLEIGQNQILRIGDSHKVYAFGLDPFFNRWGFNFDDSVKSRKSTTDVIPANPGSGPGQAPVSRNIIWLQKNWTPAFAGVTTFYEGFNFDALVKSRKSTTDVIPANPGSGPGQAPVSRNIIWLQKNWTPAFAGVTTFYEGFNFDGLVKSRKCPRIVIPVKTGIQRIQRITKVLDTGFHRGDDFLRGLQFYPLRHSYCIPGAAVIMPSSCQGDFSGLPGVRYWQTPAG